MRHWCLANGGELWAAGELGAGLGDGSLMVWCCSGDAIAPRRQRLHECWAGV